MSDFHSSREIKKTRKRYVCEQCNRFIEIGSPAHYSFGVYEGDTYGLHTHIECQAAAKEYAELNDAWGEEWPWFQHMENGEYEHHDWLLENHPIVAERLNVPHGPDTESDDPKLIGTSCQMAIEHTDGSERFARPETRREGTEA